MSEEAQETAEAIQDKFSEALEEHGGERMPQWISWVAMSTMGLALLSALCALMASITANQSLLERTREIMEVSRVESDRVTVEVLRAKHEILSQIGGTPAAAERSVVQDFDGKIASLRAEAAAQEQLIRQKIHAHEIFAIGLTLLSIGITLNGMAIITRRRRYWNVGMALGGCGSLGVVSGLVAMLI